LVSSNNPLVSVILPVFNGERYLAEAIESARRQRYAPLQTIVVDDGSTDASATVARRFGRVVEYCFQPNRGIGAARNRGVSLAHGDYFAFLDADDVWSETKLERQMATLARQPELDAVFGYVTQFHSPELSQEARKQILCQPEPLPGYLPSTLLVRRQAFFRVGQFGETIRMGEFADWYLRAVELGLKMCMLRAVVARRRLHSANNGIRQREYFNDYLHALRRSIQRRGGYVELPTLSEVDVPEQT